MRGAKCNKLDWQATATSEHIGLSMSFKDFEQSQRFVALLIKFIQDEREPCDILPDSRMVLPANPPTDTGSADGHPMGQIQR